MMRRNAPDDVLEPDPFEADDLRALEAALAGTPPVTAEDRDWADLVALVQAEPPRRDPIARVELQHKVAAGFAKPVTRKGDGSRLARPERRSRLAWLRPAMPALAVLALGAIILTAALTGTSGSDDEDSASSGAASTMSAPAAAAAPSARADAGGADSESSAQALSRSAGDATTAAPPPTLRGRTSGGTGKLASLAQSQVFIRQTQLDVTTPAREVQKGADSVLQITARAGGIVETSQVDVTDQGGSASFVLRVPSSKLGQAVADLSALGDVKRVNSDADNVTDRAVSLRDQLTDARAERDALIRALAKADEDKEISSLRARLTAARQEVARRETAVEGLKRQTDRARIDLTLSSEGNSSGASSGEDDDDSAWGPGAALEDAGRVLAVVAGVGIIVLAVLIPLGLVGGTGAFLGGSYRRRRRESALDAA